MKKINTDPCTTGKPPKIIRGKRLFELTYNGSSLILLNSAIYSKPIKIMYANHDHFFV